MESIDSIVIRKVMISECIHDPMRCIQVYYRGLSNCIRHFDHLTRVIDLIHRLRDQFVEDEEISINDCRLYLEVHSQLLPLKNDDFILNILFRYLSSKNRLKFIFHRQSSSARFAQRKKLIRTSSQSNDLFQQLTIQKLIIEQQQKLIEQLQTNISQSQSVQTNPEHDFLYFTANESIVGDHQSRREIRSLSHLRYPLRSTINERMSSVDRDIDRLISLPSQQTHLSMSDDEHLSDQSGNDSCFGSLSSTENHKSSFHQKSLETLV